MRNLGPRLTTMATNYHPQPTVGFMNPSILAGGGMGLGGTLRRPRVEYDTAPPRILSKIDIEPQFYYGWPLLNNKILIASSSMDTSAPLSPITTAAASAAATTTYVSNALASTAAMDSGSTSSPKHGSTFSMQKLDRSDTPTMSMSSPTSTMLAKKSKNSQLSEHEQQQQQNNKNTVVLCPPSRTYCF